MDIFREDWVPEGTYANPDCMHGIRVGSRVEWPKYADCPENSVFEVMGFRKPSLSTGMEAILEDTKYGSFVIWDIDGQSPCPEYGIKSSSAAHLYARANNTTPEESG